jgi:hypothetical protein
VGKCGEQIAAFNSDHDRYIDLAIGALCQLFP